ncbi:MAG: DUF2959 family protein [Pseudomonadota bacterium]
MNLKSFSCWTVCLVCCGLLAGCATTYYSVWEKLGYQKRDILQTRVERARDSQQEALQRFEVLAAVSEPLAADPVTDVDTTAQLAKLRVAYRNAARSASTLRSHIDQVDDVSQALFSEWEEELINTASSAQRSADTQELAETRQAYNTLIGTMRSTEAGISPVLITVEDSVRSLESDQVSIGGGQASGFISLQGDLDRLAKDLRRSIAIADGFVARLDR